jgi:uncharacterized protein YyaL (SSP411 family)
LRPTEQESPDIDRISGFTQLYGSADGRPLAYVCRNRNCRLPVTDIGKMLELLHS